MIVTFDTTAAPDLGEVGGKALGLMESTAAGLPVPPGFVLDVGFFAEWTTVVTDSAQWARVRSALGSGAGLDAALAALRPVVDGLGFSPEQHRAVEDGLKSLPDGVLLAVRSSSPEEDLAGASFAGGYQTTLGVRPGGLLEAVRDSFASAFSERVLTYRRRQGFAVERPTIAVVVQQQVTADVAGVAFSLNPLTNDHDEAVVDANRGLGESVVSGRVQPDHWVVHTPTRQIRERTVGGKQVAVWLGADGGVLERPGEDTARACLDDAQLREVVALVARVAAGQGRPMDIEWAIADGRLWLLQARPVTADVPLAPSMATGPAQRRVLYWDIGLMEGMTSNAPMTPLTLDWFFAMMAVFVGPFAGRAELRADDEPATSLLFGAGGRLYVNLSQLLTLVSTRRFAGEIRNVDTLAAERLAAVDEDRYRATAKIPALRWTALGRRGLGVLWGSRRLLGQSLVAMARPRRFRDRHDRAVARTITELDRLSAPELSLREVIERTNQVLAPVMMEVSFPALLPYFVAQWRLNRLVRGESAANRELADAMTAGMTENVAADLGVRLYRMSRLLPAADFDDLDLLASRLARRELPAEFLAAWDDFVARYGARGPGELELANSRYGDDPGLALEQMSYMIGSDSPGDRQRRKAAESREAYHTLRARLSGRRRRVLERAYQQIRLLGATRDTPKFLLVVANAAVRRAALRTGRRFVADGRLDRAEDVFDLTLAEIDAAEAADAAAAADAARDDATVDLRAAREARRPLREKLARVVAFPHLLDSRGRIVQVDRPDDDPSTLVGAPISRGTATGRVKVLHTPREKPIEPGDVLVAYTTDPGWTPLFVHAGAVVLEIGGVLQHGGVVAREYGKPCVAGIAGVTTRLHDGRLVEVDGAAGTVRLLE